MDTAVLSEKAYSFPVPSNTPKSASFPAALSANSEGLAAAKTPGPPRFKSALFTQPSHMRITSCGSVAFAPRLVEIYRQLEKLGHEPLMHEKMFGIADGTAREIIEGVKKDHATVKKEHNFIKFWHDLIKSGDAILVCNFDKNGIRNYIGGNTLMEMGFAHVNGKKVFLLNPIPEQVPYVDEIRAMTDVGISGDLNKIMS